ncbi:MAG: sterol desaturase family protein [Candidatus Rokuibacteriota bacterium]
MGLWEVVAPRRRLSVGRGLRWPASLALAPFNALLTAVLIAPVALAALAAERGWGLLNAAGVPLGLAAGASVLLLDLLVYFQHRLLHAAPALWSCHRVHHADVELDCSTGLRFHPIEAIVTNATVLAGVVVFGLPPPGVAAYQTLALAMTVFEHANARLPARLESRLRRVFVTPEMHRVHHSIAVEDSDANFATVFSLWDRWFGTYRRRPAGGDGGPEVGLAEFRDPKYATLPWTLAMPFLAAGREIGADAGRRGVRARGRR